MARFNAAARTLSVTGTTTFTYAFTGGLITLSGASGYTVTLANPAFSPGQVQNFYNATSGNITLSTSSGNIRGPGLTAASSQTIPTTAVFSVTSDGTNYVLTNNHGGPIFGTTATVTSTLDVTSTTTTPTVQGGTLGSQQLTIRSTSSGTKASAGVLMNDGIGSSSSTTGTLVVTGGVGVSENINWAGTATGTLSSSSATLTGGSINNMAIGASTRAAGNFTSLAANSTVTLTPSNASVTISPTGSGNVVMNPATTGTIDNINIGATTRGTGAFTTLSANNTVSLNPSNAGVTISPTGSGNVVINPATAGTIDNVAIGNTTRGGGSFTVLNANNTVSFTAGSTATNSSSGSLRVTGGVGITGDVYADGNIIYNRFERVETSTGYYLVASDVGKFIYMNNSSSGIVYVPNDSRSTIPVGSVIWIFKGNAALSLQAEGGVTITASGSFNTAEELYVRKRASNNWVVGHAPIGGSLSITGGSVSSGGGNQYRTFSGGSATAILA